MARMGGGRLGMRSKGLEDLNVYRHRQEQDDKVRRTLMSIDISRHTEKRSERPLICSGCWDALRGTGPRATGAGGCVFFVVRGPVPRNRALILAILSILAILLQTIDIKVLTDLFSVLRRRSIDIQVLSDLEQVLGDTRRARACSCPCGRTHDRFRLAGPGGF